VELVPGNRTFEVALHFSGTRVNLVPNLPLGKKGRHSRYLL